LNDEIIIKQGDCIELMKEIPDNHIDLTVTSPPYDNLRTYKGYTFDFEGIAQELFRITKDGGVVVWIVGDATVKGSESGTSFKQALYFKEIGFNLHDTMVWEKTNPIPQDPKARRYTPSFEYMFVLTKCKINTCNYIKEKSLCAGKKIQSNKSQRKTNGETRDDRVSKRHGTFVNALKVKSNIWKYPSLSKTEYQGHPAQFPEQLANDHIISWSNPGDLIFDPMMGSGTTGKMAVLNNRKFIGFDISEEYCEIAKERITNALKNRKQNPI